MNPHSDDAPSPAAGPALWLTALMPTMGRTLHRFLDLLSTKQLDAAAGRIHALRTKRTRVRLLELLREDSATLHSEGLTDCPAPVTRVRFTTSNDDYNPVCWDNNAVAWHETGVKTQVDYRGTDVESALRDYSSCTDPVDGTRLVVNLQTGEFAPR